MEIAQAARGGYETREHSGRGTGVAYATGLVCAGREAGGTNYSLGRRERPYWSTICVGERLEGQRGDAW